MTTKKKGQSAWAFINGGKIWIDTIRNTKTQSKLATEARTGWTWRAIKSAGSGNLYKIRMEIIGNDK